MKTGVCVLAVALAVAGCGAGPIAIPGPGGATAGVSPAASPASGSIAASASPTLTPTPAANTYGVLVDLASPTVYYTVSVIGVDGLAWAELRYGRRTPITTSSGHAVQLPLVSTSLTGLYMLDGDSTVEELYLADGRQNVVARLPVSTGEEAAFAVSPDDSQMAYSVLDFNRSPVHVSLYVQTFNGGSPARKIFESDTDYVWPVAWHSGLLVLAHAYGPFEESIGKAAPARDNPYSAVSYHLVDPSNGDRKVLMGACTVSGPLSPAGSGCIQGGSIDWQGNTTDWSTTDWGQRSSAAALSPDGRWVMAANPDNPAQMSIWRSDGTIYKSVAGPGLHDWAGWLDSQTIVVGSEGSDWQPQAMNPFTGTEAHVIAARGFFAAVLPTYIV